MARHLAAHDTLPEICATHLAATHEPIVIRRRASVYWPLSEGMTIAEINDLFGSGPAETADMDAGSTFGWTVLGSNPTRYDKDGRPSGTRPT